MRGQIQLISLISIAAIIMIIVAYPFIFISFSNTQRLEKSISSVSSSLESETVNSDRQPTLNIMSTMFQEGGIMDNSIYIATCTNSVLNSGRRSHISGFLYIKYGCQIFNLTKCETNVCLDEEGRCSLMLSENSNCSSLIPGSCPSGQFCDIEVCGCRDVEVVGGTSGNNTDGGNVTIPEPVIINNITEITNIINNTIIETEFYPYICENDSECQNLTYYTQCLNSTCGPEGNCITTISDGASCYSPSDCIGGNMTCNSNCQCEEIFIPEVTSIDIPELGSCTENLHCGNITHTPCLINTCSDGYCITHLSPGSQCYSESDCEGNDMRCSSDCQCQSVNSDSSNSNRRISLQTSLAQVDLSTTPISTGIIPITIDVTNFPDQGILTVKGSLVLSRSGGTTGSILYSPRWAVNGVARSISNPLEFIIGTDVTPRVNFDMELTRDGNNVIMVRGGFQKTGLLGVSQFSALEYDSNFATLPFDLSLLASSPTLLLTPRIRVDVVHVYVSG